MEANTVLYSMLGAAASALVSYGVYRAASREASPTRLDEPASSEKSRRPRSKRSRVKYASTRERKRRSAFTSPVNVVEQYSKRYRPTLNSPSAKAKICFFPQPKLAEKTVPDKPDRKPGSTANNPKVRMVRGRQWMSRRIRTRENSLETKP
jgi:hypothetical protein